MSYGLACLLLLGAACLTPEPKQEAPSSGLLAETLGIDTSQTGEPTPEQKAHVHRITEQAVCLCGTCPRRTIRACECGWAREHQRTVDLAVMQGMTEPEVLAGYKKAYGLKAFPTPPTEGLGRASYLFPYAMALLGFFAIVVMGFRMRKRNIAPSAVEQETTAEAQADEEAQAILKRELDDLD